MRLFATRRVRRRFLRSFATRMVQTAIEYALDRERHFDCDCRGRDQHRDEPANAFYNGRDRIEIAGVTAARFRNPPGNPSPAHRSWVASTLPRTNRTARTLI